MMNLETFARNIRISALKMTNLGGASHIASVFSIADILSVLYGSVLNIKPDYPKWSQRDRFILSKGHAGAGVYAALAEIGFFPKEKLKTFYQNGSDLSGHVSHKNVPGVEFSTGSLGHGLSIGTGMAFSGKLNNENHRTYVLLSDGELDEGSNWEAILFASHHCLDKLTAIVDYNKIQSLDYVSNTLALEPFADKWKSFGWNVKEVDGHNHEQLQAILSNLPLGKSKPNCIIAHTTKGKGVSFMENSVLWHYRSAQGKEYNAAIAELEGENQ
jgi:transketolase